MDNDYLIDETTRENERDTAYRIALFSILQCSEDILLAGPYIEFSNEKSDSYNSSFDKFVSINGFEVLNFNNFEIVNKSYTTIKTKKIVDVDEHLRLEFTSKSKETRFIETVSQIHGINENCIAYFSKKFETEKYAKMLIKTLSEDVVSDSYLAKLIEHIDKVYDSEWVISKALKHRIGIHHGLVPKYIQKDIVELFNQGEIRVLLSTTTITEGVNTSAKNLIAMSEKKRK